MGSIHRRGADQRDPADYVQFTLRVPAPVGEVIRAKSVAAGVTATGMAREILVAAVLGEQHPAEQLPAPNDHEAFNAQFAAAIGGQI